MSSSRSSFGRKTSGSCSLGTVNDLAVMGAEPRFLSVGFVIREGLDTALLDRVARSIARNVSGQLGRSGHRRHEGH